MGAWDELDREFLLDSDTTGAEELLGELESDSEFSDIFGDIARVVQDFIDAFDDGCEQGMEVIGSKLVAKEQTEILDTGKHPYSQGILGTSIVAEGGKESQLIGTTINHIYPMSVEYGADIYPQTRQFLKFQTLDGDIVFAREVHQKPKPFVEPAYQQVIGEIEGDQYGVFRSVVDKMDRVK